MIRFSVKRIFLTLTFSTLIGCNTLSNSDTVSSSKKLKAAKINVQLGMAYIERGNMQRAKQKLLLAMDEAPDLPEAWYSMGYFLENSGNRVEANKYYLKSVTLAPHRGDALNNYGTYLCRSGDYRGAINQFMLAVKDDQYLDAPSAYENAGLCALKMPNIAQATNYFKKALLEDTHRPVSRIELAEIYYQQGHFKLAKNELTQFLQISSPTIQSYLLEQKLLRKIAT